MGVCSKCNKSEPYNSKIMPQKGGNVQTCPDIDITSKLYQMGELTENSDLGALQYQAGGPQWNNQYDAKWRGNYYSTNVPQRTWYNSYPPEPVWQQGGDQPLTEMEMMISEQMLRNGPPTQSNRVPLNSIPSPGNQPAGGEQVPRAMLPPPHAPEQQIIPKANPPAGYSVPTSYRESRENFENASYGVPIIGGYGGQLDSSRQVHETRPVSKATYGSMQQHPLSVSGDNNPLSLSNIPNQARGIL